MTPEPAEAQFIKPINPSIEAEEGRRKAGEMIRLFILLISPMVAPMTGVMDILCDLPIGVHQ